MSDELDAVHGKLDKIVDILTVVQVSQGKTEISILEHVRRTELAEENIRLLREELDPVKTHVSKAQAIISFLAWGACILVAIATAIITYLHH